MLIAFINLFIFIFQHVTKDAHHVSIFFYFFKISARGLRFILVLKRESHGVGFFWMQHMLEIFILKTKINFMEGSMQKNDNKTLHN